MSHRPRKSPCSRFFKNFKISDFHLELEEKSATGTYSWPMAHSNFDHSSTIIENNLSRVIESVIQMSMDIKIVQ